MIIQEPYNQRSVADMPISVVLLRQPHGLTSESLAQVDFVPFPLDLTVGAHSSHRDANLVLRSGTWPG